MSISTYKQKALPIPFYEGYFLTPDYDVIGKTGKLLTWCKSNDYEFVNVSVNKKPSTLLKHRAVALVHCKGYFDGAYVDHIDRNPKNNLPSNLRWVTPSQNRYNAGWALDKRIKKIEQRINQLEQLKQQLIEMRDA